MGRWMKLEESGNTRKGGHASSFASGIYTSTIEAETSVLAAMLISELSSQSCSCSFHWRRAQG
jgi:hypothetical protein